MTIKNCFLLVKRGPKGIFVVDYHRKTKFLHSKMNYKVKLSRFLPQKCLLHFLPLFTNDRSTKIAQTIPLIIPPILENSTCLYVILIFFFPFLFKKLQKPESTK